MTTSLQLKKDIEVLRAGLNREIGADTLDYLVSNVKQALRKSLENGDSILVAEFGTRLTTSLQTLSAINQGYEIQVVPAA